MKTSARSTDTCAARTSPRPTWPGCVKPCWVSARSDITRAIGLNKPLILPPEIERLLGLVRLNMVRGNVWTRTRRTEFSARKTCGFLRHSPQRGVEHMLNTRAAGAPTCPDDAA